MKYTVLLIGLVATSGFSQSEMLEPSPFDLHFESLPKSWDEGIPLGNGFIGALIWEKEGKLRVSLDRVDLWDLRPMENLQTPEWKFSWVMEQWANDTYKNVQDRFDVPYDNSPAPTKIPGAALEFDISELGDVEYVHLYVKEAIAEVKWKNGALMRSFVHATEDIGWITFEGVETPEHELIPPAYEVDGGNQDANSWQGQDLRRLGYKRGKVQKKKNKQVYVQNGWGDFEYEVSIETKEDQLAWSISTHDPTLKEQNRASEATTKAIESGIASFSDSHAQWWSDYWSKSSLNVPNELLLKQWYLEQYKFGSVARADGPPISLQAVWTADNGRIPPWKGDFHHDLNTQLSYWPAYSGNHLDLEEGFLNWLWQYRDTFQQYTKSYFDAPGLNVPGVSTLTGEPMGGWIQYSFGPTVSAWLAQHFYWHWRYTMDREFLEQRGYPWLRETAIFLEAISEQDENGQLKLPISSSPEIHNNSREAWFEKTTNYDLSLIHWTFEKAAELASELGKKDEAKRWNQLRSQWPEIATDDTGLLFGPEHRYEESHRHFSHQMAFHPLGLVDVANGPEDQETIDNTLKTMAEIGPDYWTGYSYSWLGNLYARALDGEKAAEALTIFTNFCLPNSFHVNGDQSGKGYSKFTYRPFTLEGNFAFASGLQEMLIQSHTGAISLFPAIPKDWQEVSFEKLRTQGAFLISATMAGGNTLEVRIESTAGGTCRLWNPFDGAFESDAGYTIDQSGLIIIQTKKGDIINLTSK